MTSVRTRSGGGARSRLERLAAVRHGLDRASARPSSRAQVLAHVGVVVGEQDPRVGGRRRAAVEPGRSMRRERRHARRPLDGSQRAASSTNASAPRRSTRRARGRASRAPAAGARCPSGMRDGERRAAARRSLSTSTVPPCSRTSSCDQRQPDAGAFVRAAARALDPVEALEEARQLRGRDADAGVAHRAAARGRRRAASATAISPSNVNLKAFESRLRTIFSHMSRST